MRRYIITIISILFFTGAQAQDFYDALRYSQSEYGGTARSIAMGSAFGALGGDFISASINPAGLGFYRSAELTFSPTLNLNQVDATYLNNTEMNNKYNFNINNLSYVGTSNTGSNDGIVSLSFGIGYNRKNNFHSNAYIQGFDANTTLLNYYSDYANQINNPDAFDPHYEGLAWNTWLIDEDPNLEVIEGIYYNDMTKYNDYEIYDENNQYLGIGYEAVSVYPHQQKKTINRSGKIDEYLVSMGMNINHNFYFGASLGLLDLSYTENSMYSEIDNKNNAFLQSYELNSTLSESGAGINFKAGLIYRPTKDLRLGVAFHTPTFFEIDRYEKKILDASYDDVIGNDDTGYQSTWDDKNELNYSYRLETPSKMNLSAAYTIGKKALISVDYEMTNYGRARFRNVEGDNFDYSDHNSDIGKVYSSTNNIRIGGEFWATSNVALRAGYNLIGNPWQSTYTTNDGNSSDLLNNSDVFSAISGGIGYRQNNFFLDFAYRLNQNSIAYKVHEIYYTNPSGEDATATLNEMNHQATLTMGFRF